MSLQVNQLVGFGVGGAASPIAIATGSNTTGTISGGTVTFAGMTIGAGVVVAAFGHQANNLATAVTIAGVSATKADALNQGGRTAEVWYATIPSGTTGDVVVTVSTSGGSGQIACGTFIVTGGLTGTPALNAHITAGLTSSSSAVSADLTMGDNSGTIGQYGGDSGGSTTWTNLTKYQDVTNLRRFSNAYALFTTAGSVTVTASDGGTDNRALVLANFI